MPRRAQKQYKRKVKSAYGRKQGRVAQLQPRRRPKRKGVVKGWNDQMIDPRGIQNLAVNLASAVHHELTNPHSTTANYVRGRVNNPNSSVKAQKEALARHEKLKSGQASGPVNKGKGGRGMHTATGTIYTHPSSKIPAWKRKRLREFKHTVWQTVLLSKSKRIPNSNNVLGTFRYPIKAPECLDSERVQTMVFTPYMSAYSGIHTTFYRNIRADGTDLEHATSEPLDVIQNKTDLARHHLPGSVEASGGTVIKYETDVITANLTQSAAELGNVNAYYNHLLKGIDLDLTFLASRAFPVKISVTVVRHIQPTLPHTWTTEDKQQLFNNLSNRGLEWSSYKIEYCHEFTLPGLKKGKKPPKYDIRKNIRMNAMVTNAFNQSTTSDDMAQSSLNTLGLGLRRRSTEVADGYVSGSTYVLIKYRKVNQPQQFTYIQNLQSNSTGTNLSQLETVGLSESSFDIPSVTGNQSIQVGDTPFETSQGNEARASFYVCGKIKNQFGVKEIEAIPSIMSGASASADYNKQQSLNIDPTLTNDTNNGIYTQSQKHQTLAQNTANSGP